VRPRSKEFLFGYPLLITGLCLYYSGRRRWYLLFGCAGAIAQADLLNTFCHIHTPLIISIIRAALGWILGLGIGFVAYNIIQRYLPPVDIEPNIKNKPVSPLIISDQSINSENELTLVRPNTSDQEITASL
jgi:hypothetical protein